MNVETLCSKILAGERINFDEAVFLHDHAGIDTLAYLADTIRQRKHPEGVVSYIIDRNLNPTSVHECY